MKDFLKVAQEKIRQIDADFADIRIEKIKGSLFSIRGSEVESISETDEMGYGIRTLYKGKWGFVSGTDFTKIEEKIDEAVQYAKMIGQGESKFMISGVYQDKVSSLMKIDPTAIPLQKKIKLFLDYYKIIESFDKRIQKSSSLRYEDSKVKKYYFSSLGSDIEQEIRRIGFAIEVNARDGNTIKSYSDSKSSQTDFNIIYGLEKNIKEVCQVAYDLLDTQPVRASAYPVILDQRMAGLFAHEAFGHLSEADNFYKDEKMKKIMKMGRKFGRKILNIVDDPSLEGAYGYSKYDDDGVLTRKNYLIKNGIFSGRLHSRETAAFLNEEPTGNSRAINCFRPPIIRMSNTYIEEGDSIFEEMLKGIKLGVYVKGFNGGSTTHENFVFAAGYGYMIRDGKLAEMVRDIKLSGNVFKTLADIDMVGNDFMMLSTIGGCGKWGQGPLPVSNDGPHIRIKNVVIGGV